MSVFSWYCPKENAPYPACHENSLQLKSCSLIQAEEERLISSSSLLMVNVRGNVQAIWTWSLVPPTRYALLPLLRHAPARYAWIFGCNASVIHGIRFFVLNTTCKRTLDNDCANEDIPFYMPPFQGLPMCCFCYPGRCPGLVCETPSGKNGNKNWLNSFMLLYAKNKVGNHEYFYPF